MDDRYRRPESVLVVVYAEDGQVLLLERADRPGYWQSVTGSLEWGESAASAARRELAEETGIDAEPVAAGVSRRFEIFAHWRDRYAPGTVWNLEHEYRLRLAEPFPVRLNPDEHLRHCWLPAEEAARQVFSWTNREAIEALA